MPVTVLYYNPRDIAQRSRWVREATAVPHPEIDEDGFVARLVECTDRYRGGVLIPASDETVAAVARHAALLEGAYRLACAPWEVTQRFIEKRRTYAIAEAAGVPHPRTHEARTRDDVAHYAKHARFPCLVKPSQGHLFDTRFGTKMFRVETPEALLAAYDTAMEAHTEVLLQEYIPGGDDCGANYNAYVWGGEALVEFTAAKVRNGPPGIGAPRVVMSKVIPDVIDFGRRILRALDYRGYACVEFKRDPRDGVYKLMEVNGRHNMSTLLAVACGIDFPWLEYRHLALGRAPSSLPFREGVYWIDLIRDIAYSARHWRREGLRLRDYVAPYLRPHVWAIEDWRDPRPFARECRVRLAQLAARVRGRRIPTSL